jgi:hypothetical protein
MTTIDERPTRREFIHTSTLALVGGTLAAGATAAEPTTQAAANEPTRKT